MADGSVVIEIIGDAAKFNAALAKVERSASDITGSVGSALSSAGGALTAAFILPLGAAAAAVTKWGFDTASAAEQADIAFSTMLGPERAKEMLEELAEFARKTPFEMSGLTSATQKLLAYGFAAEDVIPLLTAVGDATAGLGAGQEGIDAVTRALGQMQAKGKAYAEEMLQLTEVGIPAWEYLADALGTDVAGAQELVTKGAVDAETAISALKAGMEGDFGGMMAEQATTLQGALSNLSDSVEGVFRQVKDTDGWKEAAAAVAELADAVGPFAQKLVPLVDGALSDLAGVVRDVAGAISSMDEGDVQALAKGLAAAAAAGPALKVAGTGLQAVSSVMGAASTAGGALSKTLGKVAEAAKLASGGAGTLGEAISAVGLAGPVAAAGVVALTAVVGVAAAAYDDWRRKQENLTAATEGLADAVEDTAALEGYAGTVESIGESSREAAMSVDELAEATARRVETMNQNTAAAEEEIAQLNAAQGVINQYAGKTDLATDAQGRLEWALGVVNGALGTSITQSDVAADSYTNQNGEVVNLTESLNDLVDAKKNEARVSAISANLTEAYQAQADAAATLAAKQAEYNSNVQEYMDTMGATREEAERWVADSYIADELANAADQYDAASEACAGLEEQLGDAAAATSEAADEYDRLASTMDGSKFELLSAQLQQQGTSFSSLSDDLRALGADTEAFSGLSQEELSELAFAYDGTAASIAERLRELGVVTSEFSGIMSETSAEMQGTATMLADAMGIPLGQFEQALSDAGISAQQLNGISSAEFAAMAANCGGSMTQLTWMIQSYNSTPIADKDGNITVDQTQLMDAEGNIYEWNGSALVDQSGQVVVDTVQLTDAQGNVVEWNGSELRVLQGAAEVDDGDLQSALDLVSRWNNSSLRTLTGSATVTTTNRTINVVETQTVQRSAPAQARMSAAPAALSAEPSQGQASAQLSAVAARLASSPLPAPLMATAADAFGASATRAVEESAARAAARAVEVELSGTPAWAERLERVIEGSADRIEEAVGAPVEIVWEMRELGRLIKEATA